MTLYGGATQRVRVTSTPPPSLTVDALATAGAGVMLLDIRVYVRLSRR